MSRFVRVPCVHSTLECGLSRIICLGSLAAAFFAQTASHAKFTKTFLTIRFLFAYSSPAVTPKLEDHNVHRTNSAPRIRTRNGQYPQSSRTRSRRKVELETARQIRNHRLARRSRRNRSRLAHHDAEFRESRLRARRRPQLHATKNRKLERASRRV